MTSNPVFVMPGTVPAPHGGVLRDLHTRYETVREVLARIDKAAREVGLPDVSPRLVESNTLAPPGQAADIQYLEIFAVSIATHSALIAEGATPLAIVGQSVGELWALAAAGHVSVEDAACLAVARSRSLSRQRWPGKMLAVGVDGRRAEHLAGLLAHPELVLACENAPRQSVLSGPLELIAEAEKVAGALGWPHTRLEVPHPTHSPALAWAARDLLATTPNVARGVPSWRVYSPWLGRDVGDEGPVELVAGALTARVQLLHAVRNLHAAGADVFVECGEHPVVTRLVEASVPGVTCVVPLADAEPMAMVQAVGAGTLPTRSAPVTSSPEPKPPFAAVSAQALVPVAVPAQTASAPPAATGGADYAAVLAELRTLYGDYLGYPPELLGEDDALEADLGVESLKQVNLLGRVADRYGLPDLRADASLLTYGSLRHIAEAVVKARAAEA